MPGWLANDVPCVHRVVTARCALRGNVRRHRTVAFQTHAASQGRCTLRTPCGDSYMRTHKRFSPTPHGGISYTCCLSGTIPLRYRVATATCAPTSDVLRHRVVAFHTHAASQGRCTQRTSCGDNSMRTQHDVLKHRVVAFHTHAASQGRCTLRTSCGDSSMRTQKRCTRTPHGGISYTC